MTKRIKKKDKFIASIFIFVLAIIFTVKFVAIAQDLHGLKAFFGFEDPSSEPFFLMWFFFGSVIWFVMGSLMLCIPESKAFRIISMIPLCIYGLLQLMALFVTMAFGGAGFEDGYVFIDILWFMFTTLLTFVPTAIIGRSLD